MTPKGGIPVFAPEDFLPGEVRWDSLEVDPEQPLAPQLGEFTRDLMLIQFPNGCSIDVEWNVPAGPETGHFVASLLQLAVGQEWEPLEWRECASVAELRSAVQQLREIIKRTPSIPTRLFEQGEIGTQIDLNELVLDQTVLPRDQPAKLQSRLFEARLRGGGILTVGWDPPHDPAGRFIVRLIHRADWCTDPDPGRPQTVLLQGECRSIPELKSMVREFVARGEAEGCDAR